VSSVEVPADHPDMGRIVAEFAQPALRESIGPPFRIVDRRAPGRVRVVRAWRAEPLLKVLDDESRECTAVAM
jgi:toxin ParE1/3/4